MLGWRHVEANDVFKLLDELRIARDFEAAYDVCGFNPWACQWRMTVLALTPNSAAILRVLQCVAATGFV